MRKRNENKFISIYEGTDKCYKVENLEKNEIYEFRICSFINELNSNFSDIKQIKTKNFDIKDTDSIILKESGRLD